MHGNEPLRDCRLRRMNGGIRHIVARRRRANSLLPNDPADVSRRVDADNCRRPKIGSKPQCLYSKSDLVQTSVQAKLTWDSTGTWNKEQYLKGMKKWFPGEVPKLLTVEDGKDDVEPSTHYNAPSTRRRCTLGDDADAEEPPTKRAAKEEPPTKRVTRVTRVSAKYSSVSR